MNFLQKLFSSGAAVAETPTPDTFPPAASGPTSHREFLRQEIRRLDGQLADHDMTVIAFRMKNMATVNGTLCVLYEKGSDMGLARQRVETEWKSLLATREKILEARNKLLSEHARLGG